MSPERAFVPVQLVASTGHRKQAEATDPLVATAVSLPTPGHDGIAAMGRTFVEEFAMLGWSRERVARLVTVNRYAGAQAVRRALGEQGVAALIDEVFGSPGTDEEGG